MHASRATLVFLTFVLCAAATPKARAENWPQWRGAKLDGISNETGIPFKWSTTENVAWRVALPGPAGATPVVWNDRIFLTSVDGRDLVLMCISTQGKELWKQKVASGNKNVRGDEGTSASPSPCTDGKHVWAFMGTGDFACFDIDGKPVWSFNVEDRYGKIEIQFGLTPTPVLDGDRLYLQLIHGARRSTANKAVVFAVDKATGREVWKQSRSSDAEDECKHSYASPILYRDGERAFLLTHGADYIIAHDLNDGREIWRCGSLNSKEDYHSTLRFVASPVAVPGLIVVPSAKNGPVLGLRPDLSGDATDNKAAFVWRRPKNTPDVPSPLVKDDIVYLCREQGTLITMDAKTGEQIYEERLSSALHRASPVYADGRIYCTGRDGAINVIRHGRKFERLATNKMGESMASSPVVSGGRIYLRTFKALYAIGEGGSAEGGR
jgi:outer membrane protein assembly factor BamB